MLFNECFLFLLKKYWNIIYCFNEYYFELWFFVDLGLIIVFLEEG